MKTFNQYYLTRENSDNFEEKGTQNSTIEPLEKDQAASLFNIIWGRYRDSVKDFLEKLASDNDDLELQELINKLEGGNGGMPDASQDLEDPRQEVVPPEADRGAGPDGGGEE
jgi:hypothetical protein